jgi:hypothetical protein
MDHNNTGDTFVFQNWLHRNEFAVCKMRFRYGSKTNILSRGFMLL